MTARKILEDGYDIFKCDVDIAALESFRALQSGLLDIVGVRKHGGVRLPYAFKVSPATINIFEIFGGLRDKISSVLETDKWILTGHCDLHRNALSGWHRDDGTSYGDGGYFGQSSIDYSTKDLGVYKVAVYLQEHMSWQDGITIEPGSHVRLRRNPNFEQYFASDLGEVLIFDQRLFHTGQIDEFPRPLNYKSRSWVNSLPGVKLSSEEEVKDYDDTALVKFRDLRGDRMSVFFYSPTCRCKQ